MTHNHVYEILICFIRKWRVLHFFIFYFISLLHGYNVF